MHLPGTFIMRFVSEVRTGSAMYLGSRGMSVTRIIMAVLMIGTALVLLPVPVSATPLLSPATTIFIDENSTFFDTINTIIVEGGTINPGAVGLCEIPLNADKSCTKLSDVFQLIATSVNSVTPKYFSDHFPVDSAADAVVLGDLITIDKFLPETAGANGTEIVNYTPGKNDPGYATDALGNNLHFTYQLTSDPSGSDLSSVPEPPTPGLVVTGMASLALFCFTRKNRRA
jgi:hypothetical protein